HAIRKLVQHKVREVVRKRPGGGGYALYAPNKGKKGKSKKAGEFPTKLAAKRAELARFPPKDPQKLSRLRKQVQRLSKDPRKAAEQERKAKVKHHEGLVREKAEPAEKPTTAKDGVQKRYEFQGLPIAVENPQGSIRKWHDPEGKETGKTEMFADYGFIDGH